MAWFGLDKLFKRSTQPRGAHVFNDEDRELAKAKQLQKAIQRQELEALEDRLQSLKQQRQRRILEEQIEDMEDELHDEEEEDDEDVDSPEDLLLGMLGNIFGQGTPMSRPPNTQPHQNDVLNRKHLSDDELRNLKEKIPAIYLKKAKKMSDEEIREFVSAHYPDILLQYDEETQVRALKLLRE